MSLMTVAKALDLENWGTIDGVTQFEQWENFEKKKLEFAVQAQQLQGSLMPQGAVATGPTPAGSQTGTGGRPPKGNSPPTAKVKNGPNGPRTAIVESK